MAQQKAAAPVEAGAGSRGLTYGHRSERRCGWSTGPATQRPQKAVTRRTGPASGVPHPWRHVSLAGLRSAPSAASSRCIGVRVYLASQISLSLPLQSAHLSRPSSRSKEKGRPGGAGGQRLVGLPRRECVLRVRQLRSTPARSTAASWSTSAAAAASRMGTPQLGSRGVPGRPGRPWRCGPPRSTPWSHHR